MPGCVHCKTKISEKEYPEKIIVVGGRAQQEIVGPFHFYCARYLTLFHPTKRCDIIIDGKGYRGPQDIGTPVVSEKYNCEKHNIYRSLLPCYLCKVGVRY